jgi:hypothetical protein
VEAKRLSLSSYCTPGNSALLADKFSALRINRFILWSHCIDIPTYSTSLNSSCLCKSRSEGKLVSDVIIDVRTRYLAFSMTLYQLRGQCDVDK